MCHFINVTEQAGNLTLDHKLYMARVAMRQMMREGYEVLAININPERPVLHIAPPQLPVTLMVESVQISPVDKLYHFQARLYQCRAHIADVKWRTDNPQALHNMEVEAKWA